MRTKTRTIARLSVSLAALALLLAACGSPSSSSAGSSGGGNAAGGSSHPLELKAGKASSVGAVLVDPSGRTLYHLTSESNGQVKCTGSCEATWPPLTVSSGQQAEAAAGVTGNVTVISRPDGTSQVAINGIPLYMYSGDTGPGEANGQGIENKWYAVTPSGQVSGGGSGGNGSSSSGGGYGY